MMRMFPEDDHRREREAAERAERRRRELGLLSNELLGARSEEDLAYRLVARVREALAAERVRLVIVGADGKSRSLSGEQGRELPPRGTTHPALQLGVQGFVFVR